MRLDIFSKEKMWEDMSFLGEFKPTNHRSSQIMLGKPKFLSSFLFTYYTYIYTYIYERKAVIMKRHSVMLYKYRCGGVLLDENTIVTGEIISHP